MYDPQLEQTYYQVKGTDRRRAAEIAYVLAELSFRLGDRKRAEQYAYESIQMFEESDVRTLEDAAPLYVELNGISLPTLIHEGVVRQRLAPLLNI